MTMGTIGDKMFIVDGKATKTLTVRKPDGSVVEIDAGGDIELEPGDRLEGKWTGGKAVLVVDESAVVDCDVLRALRDVEHAAERVQRAKSGLRHGYDLLSTIRPIPMPSPFSVGETTDTAGNPLPELAAGDIVKRLPAQATIAPQSPRWYGPTEGQLERAKRRKFNRMLKTKRIKGVAKVMARRRRKRR